ncbi:shikimate dehydrogenase [Terrilactibacillus sp. S3-3]|nr:shikimate dehydrogenase [Terrilactibacillus sp. S3-3]
MGKLFGVIGDPIGHTLSPALHEFWYKKDKLSHHYQAFHVLPETLPQAVSGMKALGISGFNVTIPHKMAIIPLLDDIDEEARMLGAVNTVVNDGGRFIGYNTDGLGFLKSLQTRFSQFRKGEPYVLVIGAGGAAKAVALTVAKYLAGGLDVANRTDEKALRLSAACSRYCPSKVIPFAKVQNAVPDYDLVIQATSIGLYPNIEESPLTIHGGKLGTVFADLIYRPFQTRFLSQAKRLGHPTMGGLPMLIYQGALAYQKWLGYFPDLEGTEMFLKEKMEDPHAHE